ncbi:hypothetical protein ACPV5E_24275, partial [Vibrio mediterranei]|uniref:hypothetical protein n=1 Tax=Vibrio mediterranei TaxID=689 RepID=UPI0040692E46
MKIVNTNPRISTNTEYRLTPRSSLLKPVTIYIVLTGYTRIQVRSATLRHLSSHAHFLEYYGW